MLLPLMPGTRHLRRRLAPLRTSCSPRHRPAHRNLTECSGRRDDTAGLPRHALRRGYDDVAKTAIAGWKE